MGAYMACLSYRCKSSMQVTSQENKHMSLRAVPLLYVAERPDVAVQKAEDSKGVATLLSVISVAVSLPQTSSGR